MSWKQIVIASSFLPGMLFAHGGGDGDHEKDAKKFNKYHNWHHGTYKTTKMMGVGATKAYAELLKDIKPKKQIIVAVIDGGIDYKHEDLKNVMWVNEGEIPGNGIDDDKNGYIDDIHGWNFLGHPNGDNVGPENLELTRIYRKLKPKYDGKSADDVSNKEEFALFEEVRDKYNKNKERYSKILAQMDQIKMILPVIDAAIEKELGKSDYTVEEVEAIETEDASLLQFKSAKVEMMKQGLTMAKVNDQVEHLESYVNNYYNIDFMARKEIIGDDPTDINDRDYGNPDIKGPDPYHGTFVAGLIGAERGNGIGIDGIANNVRIMGIRAIPGGDEYDKDVALGIRYAVDNGAQVINMSFGKMYSPNKEMVDEAIKYAESKGVLLVNAAGNDNTDVDVHPHYPIDRYNGGAVANMLTVGASSMHKKRFKADDLTGSESAAGLPGTFSNYGQFHVDLFAPGVDIVSCAPESRYDKGNGTSYSSPITAGVAALVWSYYPELTAVELKEVLMNSVQKEKCLKVYVPDRGNDEPETTKFKTLSVSGGIVNAYNALKLAEKTVGKKK